MISPQQRCLVASVLIHGTLLSVLLFAPAFTQEKQPLPPISMDLVDLKLTNGDKAGGGGNPNAQPPATPTKAPEKAPEPKAPEPKAPEPEPEPKPKTPEPKERTVKVTEKATKPVAVAPEPVHKKPDNPSQDTAPAVPVKTAKRTIKTSSDIKVADKTKQRDAEADEKDRKAAEDAAEREAADKRKRARASQLAQLNDERRRLANSLGGAAQAVGKRASVGTTIETPGPGGQAYAPYGSYLGAFYKQYWKKPAALTVSTASVVVEVVIARDGRLLDSKVEKSGYREIDDSVAALIRRYPQLRPLPDGTTDAQRTFRIKFTLDADSQL